MNAKEITATFQVEIPTINCHIALAESNVSCGRPALTYVHFEIENDRVHIVSTNGRVLLHTEVQSGDWLANEPIAFDVRAMPRIAAKKCDTTCHKSRALFVVKDGLISSGFLVARIAVDIGFLRWREVLPRRACLELETAWRKLDPKYYALAQKFAGRDNYADAHSVQGQTGGPVVFYKTLADEGELNTAVVMPLREA
ncbi:MAG: hypothetical protein IIY62_00540 [Kiritimatiellae bacterium]|nr:hypothetical protein [Kiritimatiellia bacterium]